MPHMELMSTMKTKCATNCQRSSYIKPQLSQAIPQACMRPIAADLHVLGGLYHKTKRDFNSNFILGETQSVEKCQLDYHKMN